MSKKLSHIPFIGSISDFFSMYGLGKPLHTDIMCMRLEDQPDERLLHVPLYRVNFFRVIHFTNSNLNFYAADKLVTVTDNCICFSFPGKLESWTRPENSQGMSSIFHHPFLVWMLPKKVLMLIIHFSTSIQSLCCRWMMSWRPV